MVRAYVHVISTCMHKHTYICPYYIRSYIHRILYYLHMSINNLQFIVLYITYICPYCIRSYINRILLLEYVFSYTHTHIESYSIRSYIEYVSDHIQNTYSITRIRILLHTHTQQNTYSITHTHTHGRKQVSMYACIHIHTNLTSYNIIACYITQTHPHIYTQCTYMHT